jgi:hypothetical protein
MVDKANLAFGSLIVPSPRIANTLRRFESGGSFIGAYNSLNYSCF